jgi:hypothetical protein
MSSPAANDSPYPPSTPDNEKFGFEVASDEIDAPKERYSQYIDKNGERILVEWTEQEERRVVRKADMFLLPIFTGKFVGRVASHETVTKG